VLSSLSFNELELTFEFEQISDGRVLSVLEGSTGYPLSKDTAVMSPRVSWSTSTVAPSASVAVTLTV